MPPHLQIPPHLALNQQRYNGDAGLRWVDALPALTAEFTERWALSLEPPFTAGQVDYTAPVIRADGSLAVLKLCFVHSEFFSGTAALRAFDGKAAVRILDLDLEKGALLLERLVPGEPLSSLTDDAAAMHAAAEVLAQLWQAAAGGSDLLTLDGWLDDATGDASLPATKRSHPWVSGALQHAREVAAVSPQRCLLHGDFHQDNVLSSDRGWLAIDPKGLYGDPAWDLAPLLFNNLGPAGETWRRVVRRRLDQLCDELKLDRVRAYALCAARALQSRFWSLRDSAQPDNIWEERSLYVAEQLAKGP